MQGVPITTTDHEEIKQWAMQRIGFPSIVKEPGYAGEKEGELKFDFIGNGENKDTHLKVVSWDTFFRSFEEKQLAFTYRDQTAGGVLNKFFTFINRNGTDM